MRGAIAAGDLEIIRLARYRAHVERRHAADQRGLQAAINDHARGERAGDHVLDAHIAVFRRRGRIKDGREQLAVHHLSIRQIAAVETDRAYCVERGRIIGDAVQNQFRPDRGGIVG